MYHMHTLQLVQLKIILYTNTVDTRYKLVMLG